MIIKDSNISKISSSFYLFCNFKENKIKSISIYDDNQFYYTSNLDTINDLKDKIEQSKIIAYGIIEYLDYYNLSKFCDIQNLIYRSDTNNKDINIFDALSKFLDIKVDSNQLKYKECELIVSNLPKLYDRFQDQDNSNNSIDISLYKIFKKIENRGIKVDKNIIYQINNQLEEDNIEYYKNKVDKLEKLLDNDNIFHPKFCLHSSFSGRFSSINFNIQSIERNDLKNKNSTVHSLRRAFVARDNYLLVSFDYDNLDAIVAYSIIQDQKWIDIYNEGKNIYVELAKALFKVDIKKDSPHYTICKTVFFNIIFGGGINRLSDSLKTTKEKATSLMQHWWEINNKLKQFIDKVSSDAKSNPINTYLLKRYRTLNESESYKSISHIVQGTAADILRIVILKIEKYIKDNNLDAFQLLNIHDELIFEVPEKNYKDYINKLQNIINIHVKTLNLQLRSKVKVGYSWYDLKNIEEFTLKEEKEDKIFEYKIKDLNFNTLKGRKLINLIKKSSGDDAFLKLITHDKNFLIIKDFKIDIEKFNNEILKL